MTKKSSIKVAAMDSVIGSHDDHQVMSSHARQIIQKKEVNL